MIVPQGECSDGALGGGEAGPDGGTDGGREGIRGHAARQQTRQAHQVGAIVEIFKNHCCFTK